MSRRWFSALMFLGTICWMGCAPHRSMLTSRRRFPIGIYGVTSAAQLQFIRDAGFDSFHNDDFDPVLLEELARESKRLGLRMVTHPDQLWARDQRTIANWPIEAWYLHDEPDVHRISAEEMQRLEQRTRAWDGSTPLTFSIGKGVAARDYAKIGDIVMLDWYPVPHLPLSSVAEQVRLAKEALTDGKPLWMIVQAFDWREYPQKDPAKPRIGRFPTRAEMRQMAYLAVAEGAEGVFFYTLRRGKGTLLDNPELWEMVRTVSAELKELQPFLEDGTPVDVPALRGRDLSGKAWHRQGRTVLIIANGGRTGCAAMPQDLLAKPWRPLFEATNDPRELLTLRGSEWCIEPGRAMVLARLEP